MDIIPNQLPAAAQSAYAQVFDAVRALEIQAAVAVMRGSFQVRKVAGLDYVYYQRARPDGRIENVYLGPDSVRLRQLMERAEAKAPLRALAAAAVASGCAPTPFKMFRVAAAMHDHGLFKAGGVMIGTQAFLALGNMLGVAWPAAERTDDIDFAHAGRSLAIALPTSFSISAPSAIKSLEMGFMPFSSLRGEPGPGWVNPRDPTFQIDFLTPLTRRAPGVHPQTGLRLSPIRFIEYLLEDVQQAVLLTPAAATLVNLPHPARYAVHKLIVAGERPARAAVKANKDVAQAAALFRVLQELMPEALAAACADAAARGPGWRSRLAAGRTRLLALAPDLASAARSLPPRQPAPRRPA